MYVPFSCSKTIFFQSAKNPLNGIRTLSKSLVGLLDPRFVAGYHNLWGAHYSFTSESDCIHLAKVELPIGFWHCELDPKPSYFFRPRVAVIGGLFASFRLVVFSEIFQIHAAKNGTQSTDDDATYPGLYSGGSQNIIPRYILGEGILYRPILRLYNVLYNLCARVRVRAYARAWLHYSCTY